MVPGFGYLFSFLAEGCKRSAHAADSDDLEKQAIVRVRREKLLSLLRAGSIMEVKWAATIALALLRP